MIGRVRDKLDSIFADRAERGRELAAARSLYLDLMKRSLLNLIHSEHERRLKPFDAEARLEGRDWPAMAQTMIGWRRLENLQRCAEDVIERGVPGDFIETGVWRGGALIFMRAILKAYSVEDRTVWGADSFQGLPEPDARDAVNTAADGSEVGAYEELCVTLEEVRANFEKYGLLDGQVRFLPGWFSHTLPQSPIARLSLMRLDGDFYESTYTALASLYPKLSRGGYVIVDDYGALPSCRQAVEDFRRAESITDEIIQIDWTGVYWRRS